MALSNKEQTLNIQKTIKDLEIKPENAYYTIIGRPTKTSAKTAEMAGLDSRTINRYREEFHSLEEYERLALYQAILTQEIPNNLKNTSENIDIEKTLKELEKEVNSQVDKKLDNIPDRERFHNALIERIHYQTEEIKEKHTIWNSGRAWKYKKLFSNLDQQKQVIIIYHLVNWKLEQLNLEKEK